MKKFIILDDVFDAATADAIAAFDYGEGEQWYELGSNPLQEKILDLCARHFDLGSIVGYEMWCNDTNPGWHADKDELLYEERRELSFPQCSAVYYARVGKMAGGEFYTDDLRYLPKTNRLVMFSPGIFHGVSAYTGDRFAVAINPWNHRVRKPRT